MEKIRKRFGPGNYYPQVRKIVRLMKLTILFFILIIGQALAIDSYSQETRLSLNLGNTTVKEALLQIEKNSEFFFLYSNKLIDVDRQISLNLTNKKINEILDEIFRNAGVKYNIKDRQVILSPDPKETSGFISQQPISVQGKVTDLSGAPLPGVTIVEKQKTIGTVTDYDGNYRIGSIMQGTTLVFSFVGMKTVEVQLVGQSVVNVTLEEETVGIEEVIAIGYGTMKKSDLTGSISQVKSEAINVFPATNVMQAISGKSSGIQVLQNTGAPGASMSIRIRGANSIQGSNEPLYVIDGFPISNQTILNNSDIESIEILKDASATAIYGSRGANGVILITTKRGKEGATTIDFESSYSSYSVIEKLDLMNAKEYATFYNMQQLTDAGKEYFTQEQINGFGEGTDWQDLTFRTAPLTTASLNIKGGNKKTKFSISGSTFNQEGIIEGSNYDRYSVLTNIDHEFSKKFSVVFAGTFSRLETDRKDSGGGSRGASLIGATIAASPTFSPYTEDGGYTKLAIAYPFVATDIINPLNFIKEQSTHTKANVALINTALIFKPVEEITVRISGGIENRDDRTDSYTTRNFYNSDGKASVGTSQYTSLLSENTISYSNTFRDRHRLSAVAGFTYQDFLTTSLSGSGSGFLSDNFETYDLSAANVPGIPGSGYSKSVLLSYLARINYNYQNKYFATVSFRADGSSKFSKGNKWGYFPSTALAWRISDENFLKNDPVISNLKVRTSWGETGSQAIGAYVTLNQLSSGKTVFDDGLAATFAPGTSLPGNLKWETTEQFDIGFDLGLMDNRITITADYYKKNTKDLLNTVRLPSSMGFTSTVQNVGKVQNKGLEFGLEAQLLRGDFKWNINTNISLNRNKVVKLYNKEDILGPSTGSVSLSGNINILREGQPIGIFYGYREDGYDENGFIKYQDVTPDNNLTNDDRTYIGDPNPDFIYGLNSNMSWKNFELNILIQGTYGNDLMNISKVSYAYDYGFGLNMIRDVLYNHWTADNPNAKYPKISYYTKYQVSDRFIEDGSYLRLKNIQLAYNLPVATLGLNWIRSLQIYASGQNLLTLTRYSGWDPEVNARGGASSTVYGVDDNVFPMSKAVTLGLRVRF